MGVFSWRCSKSGVPIMNDMVGAPSWMSEVVLLRPDGHHVRGIYDGYGRLHTEDGGRLDFWEELLKGPLGEPYRNADEEWWGKVKAEFDRVGVEFGHWEKFREKGGVRPPDHKVPQPTPKLILLAAYAGEQYDDVEPCEWDENQGHDLPENFDERSAYKRAAEMSGCWPEPWPLPKFVVTVSQAVDDDDLDEDDVEDDPTGEYEYEAVSEGEALDVFHSVTPIACLENYEITVERKESQNGH